MLYGFAFTLRNISCQTLYGLKNLDHRRLIWGEASIEAYINFLIKKQPKFVLGLGIYPAMSHPKILIEIECSNKFKKKLIDDNKFQTIPIKPFIVAGENSELHTKIGTSYCNLISWKIMKLIEDKKLESKYTFLHIPRNMSVDEATKEVESLLCFSGVV